VGEGREKRNKKRKGRSGTHAIPRELPPEYYINLSFIPSPPRPRDLPAHPPARLSSWFLPAAVVLYAVARFAFLHGARARDYRAFIQSRFVA